MNPNMQKSIDKKRFQLVKAKLTTQSFNRVCQRCITGNNRIEPYCHHCGYNYFFHQYDLPDVAAFHQPPQHGKILPKPAKKWKRNVLTSLVMLLISIVGFAAGWEWIGIGLFIILCLDQIVAPYFTTS